MCSLLLLASKPVSGYIGISIPHDKPSIPADPQFLDLRRSSTRQLCSQILILLSKVNRHNEITPRLFILQPASTFLSLHSLTLKAANVETPIPTATTVQAIPTF